MPVAPTYPGVYIEEIPSGVRPIRAVSTSVGAFVDFFREGPMNEPVRIQGMGDFNRRFGGLDTRSEASYSIAQFFLNGGSEAHVVRVASGTFSRAQIRVNDDDGGTVMTVQALNEGAWGNNLRLTINWNVDASSEATSFNLSVTRYSRDDPHAIVAGEGPFLNLSLDQFNERYFPLIVNEESQFIRVAHGNYVEATDGNWDEVIAAGGRTANAPPATATVFPFPAPSGTLGEAVTNPTLALNGPFKIDIWDVGDNEVVPQHDGTMDNLAADVPMNQFRRAVEQAIRRSAPAPSAGGGPTHSLLAGASVLVRGRRLVVRLNRGSSDYRPDLRIRFTEVGSGSVAANMGLEAPPAFENVQEYSLGSADSPGAQVGHATDYVGADGDPPDAAAMRGDPDDHTGIYALQNVDLFNILCLPRAARLSEPEMRAVIGDAITYCETRRSFLIIDIPPDINTVEEMETWIDDHDFRHRNTAVYFPRPLVPDPENDFRDRSIGASGTMAGLYARTDTMRGVWKAPAGVEARLRGLARLDVVLTDPQNGTLNPIAVNCLRRFPIYGSVSWGARTLVGADEMASEWKYIPIRRLALMIEETLFRGTKWVVFEPNDEPLWAKVRQNVGAFMMSLFRQGAFQGDSPKKAFYVKCDGETTTANDRNLGVVNIEVGFAPLKPAEFVVIKIQQIPDVD